MDEALLSISLTGCGELMKKLITLEPHFIFGYIFSYYFIFTLSSQNGDKVLADRGILMKMVIVIETHGIFK